MGFESASTRDTKATHHTHHWPISFDFWNGHSWHLEDGQNSASLARRGMGQYLLWKHIFYWNELDIYQK